MATKGTSKYCAGMDLATTYCCVGLWQNDRVEILASESGARSIPSYVAFTDTDRLVGEAANSPCNPRKTKRTATPPEPR